MQDSSLVNSEDQMYQQALDSVQQEIDDLETAKLRASKLGKGMGDFDFQSATAVVRNERIAAEKLAQQQQDLQMQQQREAPAEMMQPISGQIPVEEQQQGIPKGMQERFKSTQNQAEQIDYPDRFKGTLSGGEKPTKITTNQLGQKIRSSDVIIPRTLNGQQIFILKEDDWIKKQDFAIEGKDENGDPVWYTTDPDLQKTVYQKDTRTEFLDTGRDAQITPVRTPRGATIRGRAVSTPAPASDDDKFGGTKTTLPTGI